MHHALVATFVPTCSCIIIVNRGGLVGYMHRSLPHTVSIVKCGKTCCFKHNTHKTLVPTSHVVNVDDNFSQWSSGRHTPIHKLRLHMFMNVLDNIGYRQTRWRMSQKLDVNARCLYYQRKLRSFITQA